MVFKARTRFGTRAPTLGLLVDGLEDGYQVELVRGALGAVSSAGASLVCVAGGILGGSPRGGPKRNHVYDLVGPRNLDGVVILAGTIVNVVGPAALTEFCKRYLPAPICSVALELPGMPAVVVDNEVGMRSALEHLLVTHRLRRIAFVRGPLANEEAERRFRVYADTMAEHGAPVDPDWTAVGDFQYAGGVRAVATWLDERGLSIRDIDGIVASNDNMAFGVLAALQERGVRVPEDVALVGFDDVEEARYTDPPLTTVRQPLEAQGREAVLLVLSALQPGAKPAGTLRLKTHLVVRGSCGCRRSEDRRPSPVEEGVSFGFDASLVGRRQNISNALIRAARGSLAHAGSDWEGRLVAATAAAIRGEGETEVHRLFERLAEGLVTRGHDLQPAHEVLSCLRQEMLQCLTKELDRRTFAEDLFHRLRVQVSQDAERGIGRARLRAEHWVRQLGLVGASLLGTFERGSLSRAIEACFPGLGIKSCYISLYEDRTIPPTTSRLILSYDLVAPRPAVENVVYPSNQILPEELCSSAGEARSFVLVPLFFRDEILGNMLIELDSEQVFAHEALRDLVSAAVKGSMLVDDVARFSTERDAALRALDALRTEHGNKPS